MGFRVAGCFVGCRVRFAAAFKVGWVFHFGSIGLVQRIL